MSHEITALPVGRDEELLQALKQALEQLGIETDAARTYEQARIFLEQPNPPKLVFSEVNLSDGTWSAVLSLAAQASVPVHVIVVSQVVDHTLFIDVLESGGADFIMPPFQAVDVGCVIRSVKEKAANLSHQPTRSLTAA